MAFRSVPRPSSPPGAKASTECPYRAQPPHMHRNHPQQPRRGVVCRIRAGDHPSTTTTTHLHASDRVPVVLVASPRHSSRHIRQIRVRPTRTTARPETHQPLHTAKEQSKHRNNSPPPTHPRLVASHRSDPDPLATQETEQPLAPNTQTRKRLGGGGRDRTDDPLLAKQVLSQLSYAPIWWAREDLNLRPHAYQACALTN